MSTFVLCVHFDKIKNTKICHIALNQAVIISILSEILYYFSKKLEYYLIFC